MNSESRLNANRTVDASNYEELQRVTRWKRWTLLSQAVVSVMIIVVFALSISKVEKLRQVAKALEEENKQTQQRVQEARQEYINVTSQLEEARSKLPSSPSVLQKTPSSGWIYLGETTPQGNGWKYVNAHLARGGEAPLDPSGKVLVTEDTLYVRADANGGRHSSAPVIGTIPKGALVKIVSTETLPALDGGKFVWTKVTIG